MGRRRIRVADVKEILVQWDAGGSISGIAHSLGYSRPTVRKYVQAGQRVGLVRGGRRIDEVGWERAARAAIAQVAAEPRVGDARLAIAAYHEHLAQRVGSVRLSVLHQRLRDEQQLKVSWASFYRYARQHWPERLLPSPRITVRLDDPPPGDEAQIDYFYVGHWVDPETEHRHRLSAFLMTLSHSRHQFLYPVLSEDATSWLEAHVAAFSFFGGAPRRLVPDYVARHIIRLLCPTWLCGRAPEPEVESGAQRLKPAT
jgi:hypothetical protein